MPSAAAERLRAFGKPRTDLLFELDEEEAATRALVSSKLAERRAEWRTRVHSEMHHLSLPHTLPVEGTGVQFSPLRRSHKPALLQVFKPRGYRYCSKDSGHGSFVLDERTPLGNRLGLHFDMGSIGRHYSGLLSVCAHPEAATTCRLDASCATAASTISRLVMVCGLSKKPMTFGRWSRCDASSA